MALETDWLPGSENGTLATRVRTGGRWHGRDIKLIIKTPVAPGIPPEALDGIVALTKGSRYADPRSLVDAGWWMAY